MQLHLRAEGNTERGKGRGEEGDRNVREPGPKRAGGSYLKKDKLKN